MSTATHPATIHPTAVVSPGARIGYDPWLHTAEWVKQATAQLAAKGAELVAVGRNPIDAVWADRPEPSKARLIVQPDEFAGKTSAENLKV